MGGAQPHTSSMQQLLNPPNNRCCLLDVQEYGREEHSNHIRGYSRATRE